jgi:hypothetical protein
MTTAPRTTRVDSTTSRLATRQELTRFYQAIGIPAVVSATQATKMTAPSEATARELPAFLREVHAVG